MKVKINLAKDGLSMFFKPYEIECWKAVWDAPEPIGSSPVWKGACEKMGGVFFEGVGPISRPSVILFLNRQVDLEFMGWKDATGKGGHRRLYYPLVNMTELTMAISRCMAEKIRDLIYEAIEHDKGRANQ